MRTAITLDIDSDYLRVYNKTFLVIYEYTEGGDGFNEERYQKCEVFHVYDNYNEINEITDLIQRTNDITKRNRPGYHPTLWDIITDKILEQY